MQQPPRNTKREFESDLGFREDGARKTAELVDDETLEDTDVDVVIGEIVKMWAALPVEIHVDRMHATPSWPKTTMAEIPPPGERVMQVQLTIPCTGAADLLIRVSDPGVIGSCGNTGLRGERYDIHLTLTSKGLDQVTQQQFDETIANLKRQWVEKVNEAVGKANNVIMEHQERMRAQLSSILEHKQRASRMVRQSMRRAGINLVPVEGGIEIALRPASLTLSHVDRSAASGVPEYELQEKIAAQLLGTIRSFATALERLPESADALLTSDEQTLRDFLLFILNANWDGTATGETFIGIGKSDILLRWKDRDAFIAECKLWEGGKGLQAAIDQLMGRYVVWRNTRAALIIFIRDRKNMSEAIAKAQTAIREHRLFLNLRENLEHPDEPDYVLRSTSDPDRSVRLSLITVPITYMRTGA